MSTSEQVDVQEIEAPQRGLTARSVVVGTLLALLWTLFDVTVVAAGDVWNVQFAMVVGFGLLLTLGLVRYLNQLLPRQAQLSTREMTVIFVMVGVAIPWGIICRTALEAGFQLIVNHDTPDDLTRSFLPTWWAVKSETALTQLRQGGVSPLAVRWSEWWPPMLFWGGAILCFEAFAVSLVLLFKPVFVDEEKLPFPLATMAETVIEEQRVAPPADPREKRFKVVLVTAFLVGVLMALPSVVSVSPGYHRPMMPNTAYYSTPVGLASGISATLSYDPLIILFVLFFPLDVLLTAVVTYVGLYVAFPLVMVWMGLQNPDIGRFLVQVIGTGGFLGLAFWSVFFNRRRLWQFVSGRKDKVEGDQALPGRLVFSLVLVSGLGLVAFMVLGIPWHGYSKFLWGSIACTLLAGFIILVRLIAFMRMRGEMAWAYHSPWSTVKCLSYPEAHYFVYRDPQTDQLQSMFRTQSGFLHGGYVGLFGCYANTYGPHLHVLEAFRLGSRNGTPSRDILIAALITFLLVLVVAFPVYITLVHYFGYDNCNPGDWSNIFSHAQATWAIGYGEYPSWWAQTQPYIYIPIGFVIIGVIMYLRREYVGFPFSPVGYVMAVCASYNGDWTTSAIWLPMVIAYVVKRVTFKWFGVGWFQGRMAPVLMRVMLGIVTGMAVFLLLFLFLRVGFMKTY